MATRGIVDNINELIIDRNTAKQLIAAQCYRSIFCYGFTRIATILELSRGISPESAIIISNKPCPVIL